MSGMSLLKVWKNWLPLAILFWMQAGVPPVLSGPDPTGLDRLRQRANAYLEALHAGRVDQAAQYVLPASRETVDAAQAGKSRVLSFRILEVELEEGNGSALVTVSRTVMTASLMSGRMPVKQRLRWKLREGEWYLDPADPPQTYAALVKEYYYDKLAARANPKPGQAPPPLEVEFEQTVFDFGKVPQGTPVQPRFVFRNLASRDILVEKIHGPEWLIKDATEQRVVPAGADGEIRVDVDTSRLQWQITQDFFVQFEPIREMVKLSIRGWVSISKAPPALRQARQAPRPRGCPVDSPRLRGRITPPLGRRRLMRWGVDAGPRLPKKAIHEGPPRGTSAAWRTADIDSRDVGVCPLRLDGAPRLPPSGSTAGSALSPTPPQGGVIWSFLITPPLRGSRRS